jgi:hypothetical protein
MAGLAYLTLICAAILGALYLIGRAGDVAARLHRDRDPWSPQQ